MLDTTYPPGWATSGGYTTPTVIFSVVRKHEPKRRPKSFGIDRGPVRSRNARRVW